MLCSNLIEQLSFYFFLADSRTEIISFSQGHLRQFAIEVSEVKVIIELLILGLDFSTTFWLQLFKGWIALSTG